MKSFSAESTFIIYLLLFLSPPLLTAQIPPPPPPPPGVEKHPAELYVPYNDHGNWGWSDTLGNIVVPPKFKRTSFFSSGKGEAGQSIATAEVETDAGKNYFVLGKGLKFPEKYGIASYWSISFPDSITKEDFYFIKDKRGRFGLLSLSEGVVVKPRYDSLNHKLANQGIILLKKDGASTYDRYDPLSRKMRASNIISSRHYEFRKPKSRFSGGSLTVVVHQDGSLSKAGGGGTLTPFIFNKDWEYTPSDQLLTEFDSGTTVFNAKRQQGELQKAWGILKGIDYSRYGENSKKYGFSQLFIVRKNGKIGINNEDESNIVDYEYDRIDLFEDKTGATLYKDGKKGIKLFFTHHPQIPAIYDDIFPSRLLSVSQRWSFAVFLVKIKDERGYVGENAVEYFDLD